MYQEQRFERILMLLEERGNLSVKEMVDELGVSKDTVRRDFYCLSQRNLAQRTHGGILPVKNTSVLCFQERQKGLTEDKKKMADAITNPMIQNVFDTAMSAGALAGKVSGAGGGGFVMLMVEPTRKKEVIDALNRLDGFVMPFQFTEGGAHGWRIYSTDKVK